MQQRGLEALARFNRDIKSLMAARIERRARRLGNREVITFLDPDATIARTDISVRDAREGRFAGSEIPEDLKRQWIQGTGPAAKPNAPEMIGMTIPYASALVIPCTRSGTPTRTKFQNVPELVPYRMTLVA